MLVGVVGHVEWVEFARVEHVPQPGEIVQSSESWQEAGGGGAVAAVELARLAGSSTLFTALGDDPAGHRAHEELSRLGVQVEAAFRPEPQRRAFTYVDQEGERTITLLGAKLHPRLDDALPWEALARFDALYFTAGEPAVLDAARGARVLVATARELATLRAARVRLDALVASAGDPAERYGGELNPVPGLIVRTSGGDGGTYEPGPGSWSAATPPGPLVDTYGAGDSFAAGLTYSLGAGMPVPAALDLAARCGAEALTRRGAHGIAA